VVLTVPWQRRWLLARKPDLVRGVLRIGLDVVMGWYREQALAHGVGDSGAAIRWSPEPERALPHAAARRRVRPRCAVGSIALASCRASKHPDHRAAGRPHHRPGRGVVGGAGLRDRRAGGAVPRRRVGRAASGCGDGTCGDGQSPGAPGAKTADAGRTTLPPSTSLRVM
jgi:hypothetical protein